MLTNRLAKIIILKLFIIGFKFNEQITVTNFLMITDIKYS